MGEDSKNIVITSAVRTPIGTFRGSLKDLEAKDLGALVTKESLKRSNLNPNDVDELIIGQVLTSGAGQNPARQTAIKSGIPFEKTAYVINQVCGSGLRAVAAGYQTIKCNDSKIIIAGGQESMSNAPHVISLDKEKKLEESNLVDTMIKDGLWDAFNGYHMGVTAENVAEKYQITRAQQDEFAAKSQSKAAEAIKTNKFKDEIVPIKIKDEKIFDTDEYPKIGTTMEKLSTLKTVFKKDGTVTAGNASGLNDGAAALTIMNGKTAKEKNLKPLAKIVSWAQCGVDPSVMGTGPIPATKLALKKAGWKEDQLDLVEANEAFAAQAISVNKELGFNSDIVNVNGGAIALGHPIGASGARVLVTLLHEMKKRKSNKGLATLCIGGGMGIAMCVESLS